jgi:hypothetical protein
MSSTPSETQGDELITDYGIYQIASELLILTSIPDYPALFHELGFGFRFTNYVSRRPPRSCHCAVGCLYDIVDRIVNVMCC